MACDLVLQWSRISTYIIINTCIYAVSITNKTVCSDYAAYLLYTHRRMNHALDNSEGTEAVANVFFPTKIPKQCHIPKL